MAKYFTDTEIYFQGKKQKPKKVVLTSVEIIDNNKAICYDEDGDVYTLDVNQILDDNE